LQYCRMDFDNLEGNEECSDSSKDPHDSENSMCSNEGREEPKNFNHSKLDEDINKSDQTQPQNESILSRGADFHGISSIIENSIGFNSTLRTAQFGGPGAQNQSSFAEESLLQPPRPPHNPQGLIEEADNEADASNDSGQDTFIEPKKKERPDLSKLLNRYKIQPFSLEQELANESISKKCSKELVEIISSNLESFEAEKSRFNEEIKNWTEKIKTLQKNTKDITSRQHIDFYKTKIDTAKKVAEMHEKEFLSECQSARKSVDSADESVINIYSTSLNIKLMKYKSRLPIYAKRDEIIKSLGSFRMTIVIGKPGCGKSTQIPQIIYENDHLDEKKKRLLDKTKDIYLIVPKQVAAEQIYKRIKEERGLPETNCSLVQLIKPTSPKIPKEEQDSVMYFITDSEFYRRLVITQEISLDKIGYLLIDEANSKKMYTEMILSVLKKLMSRSKTIKVTLLCTSIDIERLNDFYHGVLDPIKSEQVIEIKEKNFMTEVLYMNLLGEMDNKLEDALKEIEDRIQTKQKKKRSILDANILVFLQGASEVTKMYKKFAWLAEKPGLLSNVVGKDGAGSRPYYKIYMASGSSNTTFDKDLFEDNDCNTFIKLILSTKVLETSLTIPSVGYVVDFGQEIVYSFDYSMKVEKPLERLISKDTAQQREGRVGRTSKGLCIRVYKQEDFECMDAVSDSELLYKNIDLLLLSLVKAVKEASKKNQEHQFFEVKKQDDEEMEESGVEKVYAVLRKKIMNLNLITELNPNAVQESLCCLYQANIIPKNFMREEGSIFINVLGYGLEPKWGRALVEALKYYKENVENKWLLEELILITATNNGLRRIEFQSTKLDEDEQIRKLKKEAEEESANYGDYYYNYLLYKKLFLKQVQEDIFMKSSVVRCRDQLGLIINRIKLFNQINCDNLLAISAPSQRTHAEKFKLIHNCLGKGFMNDFSKFINKDVGYYHFTIQKVLKISPLSLMNRKTAAETDPTDDDYYPMLSSVIQTNSSLESRFVFKMPMSVVEQYFAKQREAIDARDLEKIPTYVLIEKDLSTTVMRDVKFKSFILEQILGSEGNILEISERNFSVKVAVKRKKKEKMEAILNGYFGYLNKNNTNYKIEVIANKNRVVLGNGLKLLDLLPISETASFYHVCIPRYLDATTNQVLAPDSKKSPWSLLIDDYQMLFCKNTDVHLEVTYTQVNYSKDSQVMNLRVTCSTKKQKEEVYKRTQEVMKKWQYTEPNSQKCQIKFYNILSNKDASSRTILLGLIFSTGENSNRICEIKFKTIAHFNRMNAALREKTDTLVQHFGPDYQLNQIKERDRLIYLKGIDPKLDELMIIHYFKKLYEIDCDVYMKDKTSVSPISDDSYVAMMHRQLDRLEEIMHQENPDDKYSCFFSVFLSKHSYLRRGTTLREFEIRTNNVKFKDMIKEYYDNKHYDEKTQHPKGSFQFGEQYTHVVEYDRPEFHMKKTLFNRISKTLIEMNEFIKNEIKQEFESKGLRNDQYQSELKRLASEIEMPPESKLSSLSENDNVRLAIIKGSRKELADRLEEVIRNYLMGKEIYIDEKCYAFFFGPEGERYLKELENDPQFTNPLISKVMIKSTLIIKEFPKSDSNKLTLEQAILQKCREIRDDSSKLRYCQNISITELIEIKKMEEWKALQKTLQAQSPPSKLTLFDKTQALVYMESEAGNRHFEHNQELIQKLIKGAQKNLEQITQFEKTKCKACGDSINVVKLHLCKHNFCTMCIQEHVMQLFNKNWTIEQLKQGFVTCLDPKCPQLIAASDINRVIMESRVEKFFANALKDAV